MRITFVVGGLLTILHLHGCSDSSDRSSATIPQAAPTPPSVAGIYSAVAGSTFEPALGATPEEGNVNAIITADGRAVFIMHDGPLLDAVQADELPFQLAGAVAAQDGAVNASLTVYPDGSADPQLLELSGTVATEGGISADYNWGERSGKMNLAYSRAYDQPSSLERIAGTWSINFGIPREAGVSFQFLTSTLNVFSDGLASGSDSSGCTFSGMFSVIDPAHGAYEAELELSSCGARDGLYRGLAYVTPAERDGEQGRVLRFGVSNDGRSYNGRLFGPPLEE